MSMKSDPGFSLTVSSHTSPLMAVAEIICLSLIFFRQQMGK